MGKCIEWLETKGHHLMTFFIVVQTLIFITFIFLCSFEQGTIQDMWQNAYTWSVLALFLSFMIYFAYHSIRRGYFIELIAFLLMSTLSSTNLVYNFFSHVILSDDVLSDRKVRIKEIYILNKEAYKIIGITCVVLLIIGNLIYFVSAYFAYNHFELIFLEKFGAKEKYHKIFSWVQFQHSMMKCDLGLVIYLLIALFVFDNSLWLLIVCDAVFFVYSILLVVLMKRRIREENKKVSLLLLASRIVIQGYYIFRMYHIVALPAADSQFNYSTVLVISGCFDVFVLITIVYSTFKCIGFYGQGFKEMIQKQRILDTSSDINATANVSDF